MSEFWEFMRENKKYWLAPIVIVLFLTGLLLVAAQGSAVAPFIYSPYMLLVADVNKTRQKPMTAAERSLWGIDKLNVTRSDIPAVTHVDYSARIQTVHRDSALCTGRYSMRFDD